MSDVLGEILAHKRNEVEVARKERPQEALCARGEFLMPRRNFYGAVTVPRRGGPNLIAEIKRSSPSAGTICTHFDPAAIARQYAAAGAHALSVLTEQRHFGGQLEHIAEVKAAVSLPVLRKDFLVDSYQLYESRAYGADAVLLIAEAMAGTALVELVGLARELDLWVLVEVHTRGRLLETLQLLQGRLRDGVLIGINNRDLRAQRVDLATTEELAPLVPPGVPLVAESGIRTRRDVERMHSVGARALLIGESLLRSGDVSRTVREMLG